MPTFKYICLVQSAKFHNGRRHLRVANEQRLPVLRRLADSLEVIELPELMSKHDALKWFTKTYPERQSEIRRHQFNQPSVGEILKIAECI